MSSLQAELSAAALEAERTSRDAASFKEQEQVAFCLRVSVTEYLPDENTRITSASLFWYLQIRVRALTAELLELRSRMEDAASVYERELHSLRETGADFQTRADVAHKEVDHVTFIYQREVEPYAQRRGSLSTRNVIETFLKFSLDLH